MPTYDYECDACHHKFEKFQSITSDPIKDCPSCQQPSARRLMGTGGGLVFKGSGFYITDYRSDSYKKSASADSSSGKSSEGGSSSKSSESKPSGGSKSDSSSSSS